MLSHNGRPSHPCKCQHARKTAYHEAAVAVELIILNIIRRFEFCDHPKNYDSSCRDEENFHQRVVEGNKAEEKILRAKARCHVRLAYKLAREAVVGRNRFAPPARFKI